MIDNLLCLNSVNNIFVLFTRSSLSLVSGRLWLGMLLGGGRGEVGVGEGCRGIRWVWGVRRFGWWLHNILMGTGLCEF